MTKTPLRLRGLERARARIKQGTNRTRFSSIAERDLRLFIHSLCQTTEAKNLNAFFFNDNVKSQEAMRSEIKGAICPALFDETLCRSLK